MISSYTQFEVLIGPNTPFVHRRVAVPCIYVGHSVVEEDVAPLAAAGKESRAAQL